ncbi:MAG: hypothetical protein Q9163_001888 [Psora crenata]
MSDNKNKGLRPLKNAQTTFKDTDTDSINSKDIARDPNASKINKENFKPKKSNEGKAMAQQLRPSTPPNQTGFKLKKKTDGDSPDSQVIASGDCSPRSEGVRRADRKDVSHWPGAQE